MDHAARMAEFRRRLAEAGLDAYWLVEPANVRYLCGFTGEDSTLVVTADHAALISDSRYAEQAELEAEADEVISRKQPMAEEAGALLKAHAAGRVGVSGRHVRQADFTALGEAAAPVELTARKHGIAEQMRVCKDAGEVEAIRASLRLAQETFEEVLPLVEPGRAERWLAARLEFELRARGADGASFPTICAVDAHASMPHATSGGAVVGQRSAVLFDWGARLAGYCSDLTRVVCVDTIPEEIEAVADVVLRAQEAVFWLLKPGSTCGDVDAAGRAVIEQAGYAEEFGHGIGHGVGLSVHEAPRIGPAGETVLKPGMVVTVEPGVYLPGRLGVRIEEMALITPHGHEVLTTLPQRPRALRGG